MSLGDKLQATLKELEDAKIKGAKAQAAADMAALRKKRQERKQFVDGIEKDIINAICEGKVPYIQVHSYEKCKWIEQAQKGKAEFQDLWSDLIQEMGQEKLRVDVNHAHDGMGLKEWIEITVTPSKHKIVYRDGIRQPTPEEKLMDPRPTIDRRMVPSTSYGKPYQ